MQSEQYDELISAIYQGPLETTPWQQFLPLLADLMNAMAVSLVLRPPAAGDSGLILNYQRPIPGDEPVKVTLADPTDWQALAYREYFFALDPFVNLPIGDVVTMAELVPEHSLKQSEYYQRYLKPAGIYHILGTDTREPNGLVARLRACRAEQEPAFSENDKALFSRILPHLRRAIQFHARLNHVESERDLYASAVDRLAVGTIILDENAKLLKANDIAKQLIDRKDGLFIVNEHLQLSNREQGSELQTLVNELVSSHHDSKPGLPAAMRISRPSGLPDLGLVIRPVPVSEWSEGQSCPTVALFISDPEQQPETSQQTITRLFGFTPAEAALAMQLTRGLSLAEASEQLGISQHTARAQLKSIFSKTGVSRQAELVRLIVKSVANFG
jgi:DNA-binding CsgD family transcriptional regulator